MIAPTGFDVGGMVFTISQTLAIWPLASLSYFPSGLSALPGYPFLRCSYDSLHLLIQVFAHESSLGECYLDHLNIL